MKQSGGMKISKHYNSSHKRLLDVSLAIIVLLLSIPLLLAVFLLVLVFDGRPIFFKQKRMGKEKKVFTIYKIRTMVVNAQKSENKLLKKNEAPYPMFKITNDPRFTTLGKKISNMGLDEVPQIINILKGEMSFIGPRPLPIYQAEKLDSSWNYRYKVQPGILSKWALSEKRYNSLKDWKKIEKKDLRNGSVRSDLCLIYQAITQVFLKNMFT